MKVYEALADAFIAEGTTDVFGMMGDANMHWMNAMADRGTRLYEVRHEGCGLGMADGWSRAAGRPGVVTATSGPGVSQLATSLLAASRAGSSVVAFCGEVPLGDEGAVQYLDQRRFARATESEFIRVAKGESAQSAVSRAFYIARTQHTPVLLSAPMDTQKAEFDGGGDYVPSSELIDATPIGAPAELVTKAARMVAGSRRVVVIAGRGAREADAGDAVLRLLELSGAILATTLQTKLWLRADTEFHAGISGLYGSKTAQELLQEADCVIAVGASLNHYTTEYGYLYPDAKYIHLDNAPNVVMGTGRLADCYLQGDAQVTLAALNEELAATGRPGDVFQSPEIARTLAAVGSEAIDYVAEPGRLDPRQAIRTIDAALPTDIPIVLGSGHQTDFGTMLFDRPRRIVSNYGMFGAIGQAPLITMGWLVGTGNRPTAVVEGDASFIMHLAEFETACRYNWPMLVVVMNDEGLGAEYHKSKVNGLQEDLSVIPSRDLGNVARALGGEGALATTTDQLSTAVAAYAANPRPTVIDARITRQVLSTPYRRLWYAEEV